MDHPAEVLSLPVDDEAFPRVYQALAQTCRRRVFRERFALARQWGISPSEYTRLVAQAVDDSFNDVQVGRKPHDPLKSTLLSWLVLLADQALYRRLRYIIRDLRWHTEMPAAVPDPQGDFTRPVLLRLQVDHTMAQLAERQAKALQAHYLASRSVRDMAVDMGVSETTVQSLLQRGRERFKVHWEGRSPREEAAP